MKLGLYIANLVIFLCYMDHRFFLEEILRLVGVMSVSFHDVNTLSEAQLNLCFVNKIGSLHCYTWSTRRCSTFGICGWPTDQAFHASL